MHEVGFSDWMDKVACSHWFVGPRWFSSVDVFITPKGPVLHESILLQYYFKTTNRHPTLKSEGWISQSTCLFFFYQIIIIWLLHCPEMKMVVSAIHRFGTSTVALFLNAVEVKHPKGQCTLHVLSVSVEILL